MAWLMKQKGKLRQKDPHFRVEGRREGGGSSQLIAMWALVSFFWEEVELGCCCLAAELTLCKKHPGDAHPHWGNSIFASAHLLLELITYKWGESKKSQLILSQSDLLWESSTVHQSWKWAKQSSWLKFRCIFLPAPSEFLKPSVRVCQQGGKK